MRTRDAGERRGITQGRVDRQPMPYLCDDVLHAYARYFFLVFLTTGPYFLRAWRSQALRFAPLGFL